MAAWFAGWVEAERGRFILWLAVAMGVAILVYFALPAEPPLWLGPALALPALAVLLAGWRWPPLRFVAALALAGGLGFTRAEWRSAAEPPLLTVPYGAVAVTGTVAAVTPLPMGQRLTLADATLDGGPVLPRTLRVRLRNADPATPAAGAKVSLKAMLFRQDRPAYPGAWDFGRDAFFQGLGASGFALTDITIAQDPPPAPLATWLANLRAGIAARIIAVLGVPDGSVAVTLLTGLSQAMPAAERQAFVAAGLAHLLAVAGLHVGIVMGLVFGASRFLLTRPERLALHLPSKPAAAVLALLAGAGYAALTGAHLPILRSLAMASLVTLGVLAGRRAISLRGLALAALLIMLATPEAVVGVSFQMSFSAVLALIAGYAAARDGFAWLYQGHWTRRTGGHVAALAFTSLLAGGASMPFAAYQFQQIQPYWILANLVAVPLTAFWVMPFGLAALALMPFGLAAPALIPMGWGIAPIVWMTARIAAWPGAMLQIPKMPDAAILLFAFGLAWLGLWRSRARFAGLAFMAAAALVYATVRPPDALVSPDGRLIAVRTAPAILLLRQHKAAAYTLAQWRPVWAGTPLIPLDPRTPPPGAVCDAAGCTIAAGAGSLRLVFAAPVAGCGSAALVLSPVPLRGACDAAGRIVIDRFSVWHDGAIAVWIAAAGPRLRSDRQVQGQRPWVPAWPQWRTQNED